MGVRTARAANNLLLNVAFDKEGLLSGRAEAVVCGGGAEGARRGERHGFTEKSVVVLL